MLNAISSSFFNLKVLANKLIHRMATTLVAFRIFLLLSGFYPPSLIRGVWFRRAGIAFSMLLTTLTFSLLIQDAISFRRIASTTPQPPPPPTQNDSSGPGPGGGDPGAGGPVIPFTLQLYPTVVHLAILLLRLYIPPDCKPLLKLVHKISHLGGVKSSPRVWIYLLACILQLSNTVYAAISFPTAIQEENEKFYSLNNLPNVLFKGVGVLWVGFPVMDVLGLGVAIYLSWARKVVHFVAQGVSRHKKELAGGSSTENNIYLQEIWRGGGGVNGKLGRELEVCRQLWTLWEDTSSSSQLLGHILLHCLWAWSSLFCIVTFNLISYTVDVLQVDLFFLNFLLLFSCLGIKLIVITDSAELLHSQVTSLERSLVEVRLEWEKRKDKRDGDDSFVQLHALVAHRPISVTAKKYFKVGRRTLTGVMGVVSTYVVVLLQFWASTRRPLKPN